MQQRKGLRWLMLAVLFAGILCICAGCGKKEAAADTEVAKEQPETVTEVQPDAETAADEADEAEEAEPEENITAELSDIVTEEYGNDQITLMTKRVNDIRVTILDNEDAADDINAFFEERDRALEDTIEVYTDLVETAYFAWKDQDDEEAGEWKPYEFGREYSIKRLDEQMICIVEDGYVYTGGERTVHTRISYNFDTWTGSRLSLETAASHLDEIRMESLAYIGELLLEPEYADILKKNYTDYLEDILTDNTWYTNEEGLYIICNEDIIAPAKEGIMEFFLPYDEVDVIDEIYLPEEKAD